MSRRWRTFIGAPGQATPPLTASRLHFAVTCAAPPGCRSMRPQRKSPPVRPSGLGKQGPSVEKRLRVLLETCAASYSAGGGAAHITLKDDDLLRLAREIQDLRKELQLGGLG